MASRPLRSRAIVRGPLAAREAARAVAERDVRPAMPEIERLAAAEIPGRGAEAAGSPVGAAAARRSAGG